MKIVVSSIGEHENTEEKYIDLNEDKLDIELFFSSLELNTNSQTDIMKKIPLNLVLRSIGKLFRVRLEGEKKQGTL